MAETKSKFVFALPRCGSCGAYINNVELELYYLDHINGRSIVRSISPGWCPECKANFYAIEVDAETHICTLKTEEEGQA